MRSATSCFNSTLYTKTMARFWPLWVLHGLIWLFVIPLTLVNRYFDYLGAARGVAEAQEYLLRRFQDIPYFLEFGLTLAVTAGVLCAMAVFGYLYNHRSAAMMHALPMNRTTLFTTQYLAGLSFLLLPLLAVGLITVVVAITLLPSGNWGEAMGHVLTWLLGQCGFSLFFYSFAAFCAMFTGHILALPAFYGILNILVCVLYYLITTLISSLFYGVYYRGGDSDLVRYLTPVWALSDAIHVPSTHTAPDGSYSYSLPTMQSPGTVAAYAAVGVVLAVLALLVYRQRHVESAGDVVSIPIVRPVFQWGVAFCSGLCFGVYTAAFFGWDSTALLTACVLVWTVVGFFVAEMLLKKSFRVLRAWKRCLIAVTAMALLCAACAFDWFGVETRVPDVDEVLSVTVHSDMGSYPRDDGGSYHQMVTDPETIQRMIHLHSAILQDRNRPDPDPTDHLEYGDYRFGDETTYFDLVYSLKDGSILARRYTIPLFRADLEQEGSFTWQMNQLTQDRELVESIYDFDRYEKLDLTEARLAHLLEINSDSSTDVYLNSQYLHPLWEAVRADFDAGTIGVRYLFDDEERRANTYQTDLIFEFTDPIPEDFRKEDEGAYSYRVYSLTITLTPNASRTLAVLEEAGIPASYRYIDHPELEEETLWTEVTSTLALFH